MLPQNLSSLSDAELLRFVEDRSDPLIAELCKRVEGVDYNGRIHELEAEVESLAEKLHWAPDEIEFEERGNRIDVLEALLKHHKIEVPA